MVSPYKKKADKKGKASVSLHNRGSLSTIRKGSKPLAGKKIYLDIRNQTTSKKLEEQIILLGGGVETFLVSNVSYLVTDKKASSTNGSSPHPLSASSPSPSDAAPHQTRTRTRGEAMLYRVKQGTVPTSTLEDIFERASLLGIPVYPLVRFTEYIAKLLRRVEKVSTGGNCTPTELRGSYLKLETGLRPELRVLSGGWPHIDLSKGSQGASVCAFASPQHDTNNTGRMTRKSGNKLLAAQTKNSSSSGAGAGGGAGYCEVCRVNYNWLDDHLSSVGHIKAVTDPTQYQELDSLITASGWIGNGQRKSLRIKSPPPFHQSPPTPTILNCNGHQNNTHQAPLVNGFTSLRRSVDRKSPRRCRVVRKRLSAEEKLIEDNKAYYKVEVLNSKLRSTGTLQRQLGSSGGRDDETSDEEDSSNSSSVHMGGVLGGSSLHNGQATASAVATSQDGVVVRFKKVRKTELLILNDEAENFMFGEKKDETTPVPNQSESNQAEEATKKKRRTHAEVFINDNTDYYKFELPGSRLRYQGTTLAHVPTPAKEDVPQSRLRSNKSPPFDDHSSPRLRSTGGKSPPKEKEEVGSQRLRSNRSPIEDEQPSSYHRLRSLRSPIDDDHNYRLRLVKSPIEDDVINHRLRSGGRSPMDDEPVHRLRLSGRSPNDDETSHHRLRSGGKSPRDEEQPSHHRLRSSRNPYDDDETSRQRKSPETSHPRLRSGGGSPPPLEPKLRSCPGLSPIKDTTVQRICLPSEDDLAPELSLSHADITFAFELANTDGVWSEVRDRLDNFNEDILPHYYPYPKVVLPCEMPYLERLKLLTRRRRRMSRCLDDKPRKSPRCHASTLAIMSSVLPTKARPGDQPIVIASSGPASATSATIPSAAEDEDTTASSLTAESTLSDTCSDSRALLQRHMQHFLSLLDCTQPKAGSPRPHDHSDDAEDNTQPVISAHRDFLAMVNDDCPLMDMCMQETMFNLRSFDTAALDSCNSSDCSEIFGFYEDGRTYFGRRKKKKRHNLTGWPKEKPRRKFLAYAKKPRFLKSEASLVSTDPDTESSAVVENFVLSLNENRSETTPQKKRGRPRLYPPGMSPSCIKAKLARESALRRSSSISPVKHRPSLKVHPL